MQNKTARNIVILSFLGLAAGFLGGLLGIGGGALIVPGLVFLLNMNQHKAHGTSLLSALLLALSGVVTYTIHGNVDYILALEIAVGGVIGATVGVKFTEKIKGKALRQIFCVFLLFVGIRMIINGFQDNGGSAALGVGSPVLTTIAVLATGVVTGFLSSLLGIGGGMVMIPAMVVVLGVSQKVAQGVSLAAMIPTAFTGVVMHNSRGNVDRKVGFTVGAGAIIGAVIGGSIAAAVDPHTLKFAFGIFLLIMSLLLVFKK